MRFNNFFLKKRGNFLKNKKKSFFYVTVNITKKGMFMLGNKNQLINLK